MASLDLRPEVVDITGYAGDTMSLRITVSDPAVIAGGTWLAQVRAKRPDTDALATFDVTPETGGAVIQMSAADTAALGNFKGAWDVQVAQNGTVRTLIQGAFVLELDVSRQ
jgi:hypothetical protein